MCREAEYIDHQLDFTAIYAYGIANNRLHLIKRQGNINASKN